MDENQNYVEIHRHQSYQITLEDYYKAIKDDNYKRKFNDIAWGIFNERTVLYQQNKEYTQLRYNFFYMANLLMEENKKKLALKLYLKCLVIDLSGIESIDAIKSYKSGWCTKKEFLERLEYNCLIPSLITQIIDLKEEYEDTLLCDAYNEIYLPFNVSSVTFIKELINEAFSTSVFDFERYEKNLINNKKKKYLEMV